MRGILITWRRYDNIIVHLETDLVCMEDVSKSKYRVSRVSAILCGLVYDMHGKHQE